MEAKQLKLLKESHMAPTTDLNGNSTTAGGYMRFCLDGGMDFVTSKEFVEFDDANNLMHCICMNEDYRSQCDYPIKIISTDYGIVQQVESIYSKKNFEEFLKTGFLSGSMSEEKKKKLIEWANSINNQALKIDKATPYYKNMPEIVPSGTQVVERNDGIKYSSNYESDTIEMVTGLLQAHNAFKNAKPGSVLMIDKKVVFPPKLLTISCNDVLIISNGSEFRTPLKITGNGVTLKGFTFNNKNNLSTPAANNSAMIYVEGDNFSMENCTVAPDAAYARAIYIEGDNASINNCVFENAKNKITTCIEFADNGDKKITSAKITNNKFRKGSSKEDSIGVTNLDNGAIISISNNVWEYSNAALRISNSFNSKDILVDCRDNRYGAIDMSNPAFVVAKGVNGEDFKNVTIQFRRLVRPDGKVAMSNGTGLDRVMYITTGTTNEPILKFI